MSQIESYQEERSKRNFLENSVCRGGSFLEQMGELAAVAREDINFRGDSMVLSLRAKFVIKNQGFTLGHAPSTIEIPNLKASKLGPNKR